MVRSLILVHKELVAYRVTVTLAITLAFIPALILGIVPLGSLSAIELDAFPVLVVLGGGGAMLTVGRGSRKARSLLDAHGICAPGAESIAFIWGSSRMISRAEALGILDDDHGGRGDGGAFGVRNHLVEWVIALAVGTAVPLGVVLLLMTLVPDLSSDDFNAVFFGAMALMLFLLVLLWWRFRRPRRAV